MVKQGQEDSNPRLRATKAGASSVPGSRLKRKPAWSERHELAASLVAEGTLTNVQICGQVEIALTTLTQWKRRPDFVARVDELLEAYRTAVRRRGIAVLERRIDALTDRWTRMQKIIEERAKDVDMAEIPGGTTGLLIKVTKGTSAASLAKGPSEYTLDIALLKELREHEKQAAQELGQWVESQENEIATKLYITVGPDDL